MAAPKVLILRAPGTNCDQETGFAFQDAGGAVEYAHINQLIASPATINDFQILCLPGGFSYGDDIAAGRILGSQMQSKLADVLHEFHAAKKLILGICNGFQVLIKSGLLLPADGDGLPATLTWNDSGRFVDRWVNLRTDSDRCVFLTGVEQLYLPIAHAEGKFVPRDETYLEQLQSGGQLALKYCEDDSLSDHPLSPAAPFNPNGSTADVAGVCDASGRIFGLMPHPERHIDVTHHPRWTRRSVDEREGAVGLRGDGFAIFENAIKYFG